MRVVDCVLRHFSPAIEQRSAYARQTPLVMVVVVIGLREDLLRISPVAGRERLIQLPEDERIWFG